MDIRSFFRRWPRFYHFVANVFGPLSFLGMGPRGFLKKFPRTGRCLNLGAGVQYFGPEVENVDVAPAPEVHIVADIRRVPLPDGSVARIICNNVLEHVVDPRAAVQEIFRLLEPGGLAYISTPFLYPFHAAPNDYQRWTSAGFRVLFSDFEMVKLGTRAGPFSALNVWLCYTFATLLCFGSERLFWLLMNASIFLFFPVKLLDVFCMLIPQSIHSASIIYGVVRKPFSKA